MFTSLILLLLCFQEEAPLEDAFPVADRFSEAIEKFNSVERSESEPLFEAIIKELEGQTELDEDAIIIMTESLKYMGVLTYPDQTESYFEKLIRFDPTYVINSRDISPKIVEVFDALKARLVALLRVVVKDADTGKALDNAELYIDGRNMGSVFGEKVFSVFTGPRQAQVRAANYEGYSAEIEVNPEAEGRLDVSLVRVASQINLVTYPADAQVTINGEVIGTTSQQVPRSYQGKLGPLQVRMEDCGALILDDMAPGVYTLEVSKPCFRPKKYEFAIDEPAQIFLSPVKLEPARATLNVSAATEGTSGLVFLGTERVGYLPIENHAVCPGEYELRVRFTDGEYIRNVRFEDEQVASFTAEPLPSVIWFGLEDDSDGKPPGDMDAWMTGLQTWNVRPIDPFDTSVIPVNPFPLLFSGKQMTADHGDTLKRQIQGDLYVAARVVRHKVVIRNVEVAFWSPLSSKIHLATFDFREFDRFKQLLERLDNEPALIKPWLGLQVARMAGLGGLKVLEVQAGGPLEGKVNVGEIITGLNGQPMLEPSQFIEADGSRISLEVGGRILDVVPAPSMAEVPFDALTSVPPAMLARLSKMATYHPNEMVRKAARFNQARFQLLLGDYKPAFDIFSTMNLGENYGINQGTLYFYQGLCFRRLNLTAEAAESFKAVLAYPNATLFDAYGPKAAFWADAEMKNPNL